MKILDACCGQRAWWKGKDVSRVVFIDTLLAVRPTVQADARYLPFHDGVFSEIWCDPPHLIRNDLAHWNPSYLRYGHWKNRTQWLDFVRHVDGEFARVAASGAILHWKMIDGHEKKGRVTRRTDVQFQRWVVFNERVEPSKFAWSTCQTHFIDFQRVS